MIWKWLQRRESRKREHDDAPAHHQETTLSRICDIGQLDSVCPHCKQILPKKPSRKTTCPDCGSLIYVRTRPVDRQRVLVTEAEAAQLEALWDLGIERERYIGEKEALERERATLAAKFGCPPSDLDVRWWLLNKQTNEHLCRGNWGLYTTARFDMARVLHAGGRLEAALATYLEVSYLHLNGPSNTSGATDVRLLRKYPPFSPELGSIPSGVVDRVRMLVGQLDLHGADVRRVFLCQVAMHCGHLELPLAPQDAWPLMEAQLFA